MSQPVKPGPMADPKTIKDTTVDLIAPMWRVPKNWAQQAAGMVDCPPPDIPIKMTPSADHQT